MPFSVAHVLVQAVFPTLELLDQGRALQVEQPGRLSLVAAGTLQRSLNQLALDARHERVEIEPFVRERQRRREAWLLAVPTSGSRSPTSICERPAPIATARSTVFSS